MLTSSSSSCCCHHLLLRAPGPRLRHHHCVPQREANAVWLNPRIEGLLKMDTNMTLSKEMVEDTLGNYAQPKVTILAQITKYILLAWLLHLPDDFLQSAVQHHGQRLCVGGLQRQTEGCSKEREGQTDLLGECEHN